MLPFMSPMVPNISRMLPFTMRISPLIKIWFLDPKENIVSNIRRCCSVNNSNDPSSYSTSGISNTGGGG